MYPFLALDGGGTKTDVAVFDASGRIGARATLGPTNLQNLGENQCLQLLDRAIHHVLAEVGQNTDEVQAACLGVGGLDTEQDLQAYRRIVEAIFGSPDRVRLESDGYIALYSGTLGKPGLAVIAGTGSMAVGVNERGERARSGGWGTLFGDEGSAYDVGRRAVMCALQAADGRGPETRLSREIESHFSLPLLEVVARLYRDPAARTAIAGVARAVDRAAQAGDAVARGLLRDAARELAVCADAVLGKLSFRERCVPVVLCGGLFRSRILADDVVNLLVARDRLQPVWPTLPPIAGACMVALLQSGHPVTPEVLRNLDRGLSSPCRS